MRVIEATIAILLIVGTLLIVSSQRNIPERRDLSETLPSLLDEIAHNLTLREEIIKNNDVTISEAMVEASLGLRLRNPSLNYKVEICNLEDFCALDHYPDTDEEIFAYERVVSSSLAVNTFEPKKIKVFLWRKS